MSGQEHRTTTPVKIMHDVTDQFSSNAMRLGPAEWLAVGVVVALVLAVAPALQQSAEPFDPGPDYRIPYTLSEDYFLFARYASHVARHRRIAVIGDSVIWGHYVRPGQTLSHYLNQRVGRPLFANMGVDGTRPVALAGLVRYYATAISCSKVLLHFNPLWLSSPEADLSPPPAPQPEDASAVISLWRRLRGEAPEPINLNHARLVPQVFGRPYGYRPTMTEAASAIVERYIPFLAWARHLRLAYFDNFSLLSWSIENPLASPLKAVTGRLPQPEDRPASEPAPWRDRGIEVQDFTWVDLDRSYQWRFFQRTVRLLKSRGNSVFVIVGPLNTHMLTERSASRYSSLIAGIVAWLEQENIPHCAPPPLPSHLYADASHPLTSGYNQLSSTITTTTPFTTWLHHTTSSVTKHP